MCLSPTTCVVVVTVLKKIIATVSPPDRNFSELSPRKASFPASEKAKQLPVH